MMTSHASQELGNYKLFCKSEDLRRAYILVSDRIITTEPATVLTTRINKLESRIIRYVVGLY